MVPTLKLSNNSDFPVLGMGTSQAQPGETEKAVKDAIDIGYRHFDSAMVYGNDHEVGAAVRAKIADGTVKREDLFITNKLWSTFNRPAMVVPACKKSLEKMGLDYLDLYLLHFPIALKEGDSLLPVDEKGNILTNDVDYVDTWKAMEECVELGLTKSIGLSNFNSVQMQRVLDVATIRPVVNQIECHPYLNQSKLIGFCKERGIVVTAYAPFGRPGSKVAYIRHDVPSLLEDQKLKEIAMQHGKTVAQVILRYLIQRGVATIPKSSSRSRLKENFEVFNFELTPCDVRSIDALNSNTRIFTYPQYVTKCSISTRRTVKLATSHVVSLGDRVSGGETSEVYTYWKHVNTCAVFTASSSSSSSSSSSCSWGRRNTGGNHTVNPRSAGCRPSNYPHALSNLQNR